MIRTLTGLPRAAMLNFDISRKIIAGFALHWTWVWLLFWSSMFYAVKPVAAAEGNAISSLEPLWNWSFIGMLVALAALYCLSSKRKAPLGISRPFVAGAGAVTAAGTLLVTQAFAAIPFIPFDIVYTVGALATGVGSAMEIVLWGEMLTNLGARQTVVYFVGATVVSALLYFALVIPPHAVGRLIACILPAFEMLLFWRQVGHTAASAEPSSRTADEKDGSTSKELRKALKKILSIALLFGVSYGIMKGMFATSDPAVIGMRNVVNAVALILGSTAIYLTMAVYRMDFGRLTYQIALPLMAAGFLLFPLSNPANLFGFGLHQFGYQYFYTIIWAMWPVFAQQLDAPGAKFACIGVLGVQCGQFFGSILGSQLVLMAGSRFDLAMTSATLVFVTLVLALAGFGNPSAISSWHFLKPFDQERGRPMGKYKRSIQKLGQARGLTPREMEVFVLLAHGRNRATISTQLVISEGTAKTHIKNIYRKFGIHSQQALLDMIELDAKNR